MSTVSTARAAAGADHRSKVESLSRSELQQLQLKRLQRQVARAHERSPFYRDRLDGAGVSPADISSIDDLRRLPFVTKAELRSEQERNPPFGTLTTAERTSLRQVHPTTGSTGAPIRCLWSQDDLDYMIEVGARAFWSMGVRPGMIVHNALSHGLWAGGVSADCFAERVGCLVVPIGGSANTERQVDYLLDLKPEVLVATPSFGVYLSEQIAQRGGRSVLGLQIGIFGGEPGAAVRATRGALEEALGLRAYDYYGATELGMSLCSECSEQQGLHWPEDHLLMELVDRDSGEPVPDGSPGVVVVTHLSHTGFPLLRYWTNDLAVVTREPCTCGRTLARLVGGILGRADDLVIFKGTNFYPMQVEQVVRSFPGLGAEYRILLSRDDARATDRCVVSVELAEGAPGSPGDQALVGAVQEALRGALGFRPEVELCTAQTLARTDFKSSRVTDLRKD